MIDLSKPIGPATHRASGFLWSLAADRPSDDLLIPLKPKLFRCCLSQWDDFSISIDGVERMAKLGARIHIEISDEYAFCFKGYEHIDKWPGDEGDWSLWDSVITDCVRRVAERGLTVQWDLWEEPNYDCWWRSSYERFLETWTYAYRRLKELDPEAVIVGPSTSEYSSNFIETFLLYAKEHEVLPDVLTWHELTDDDPAVLLEHVAAARNFMRENGIDIKDIDINEYVSADQVAIPGIHVWHFKYIEEAEISGACKACWGDEALSSTGRWPTLDGLLSWPGLEPRSTWWTYKAYADITGTLVEVIGNHAVQGVAGVNDDFKAVRILLGRSDAEVDTMTIPVLHIDKVPWLAGRGSVHVTAQRIPHTGWEVLPGPIEIYNAPVAVQDNAIILDFPEFGPQEALVIELTAVQD